jgi:hypothetical protein
MKNHLLPYLIAAAALGTARPAAAQTGRIAHFSHGGSAATLAADVAADNFGLPDKLEQYVTDSLVYLNDSMATRYGRYRSVRWGASNAELQKKPWQSYNELIQYYLGRYESQKWQEAVQALQQREKPKAKLIGFDKQLKMKGRRQKSASQSQVFSRRPFQYSFWRGVAGVAGLGAVGWLLGRKRAA